ncbi:VOC family protein [Lysinimonas soli]|uniref:VOC family protein n=1 Tax=Lysinimonas soli TaxID=1074233 RepID=A0ABW0NNH8_9MICO
MTGRLRCEIFSADLNKTVDFYERVMAFRCIRDDRSAGTSYVAFERGEIRLGAAAGPHDVDPASRRPLVGVELVIVEHRRMASEWQLETTLVRQPWGLRDFRLCDPDGYYWRVTSPTVEGPARVSTDDREVTGSTPVGAVPCN